MRRNGLLFAIMLLVCSVSGLAQINTGKISGFVSGFERRRHHRCACDGDK